MADIERKESVKIPEEVETIPDEIEIPEDLRKIEKKEGIQTTKTQFTAQVSDDQGKPLTQSPPTQVVSIEIPQSEETLKDFSKGDTKDAKTWWAASFLRMIKKAVFYGWNIVRRRS